MSRRGISRQQQAFESLLDLEADFPVESVQPSRKTRSSRGNSKTRCTDIQFRHPEGSTSTFRTVSREGGLEALHELFGTAVELDIIRDVYGACGGNVESATDALLALTTESLPEALSGAPMAEESSSSSSQGGCLNSFAASSICAWRPSLGVRLSMSLELNQNPHIHLHVSESWGMGSWKTLVTVLDGGMPADLWDRLAEDVKEIIWRHVAQRDCARAAGTCREFAKHARSVQLGVKTLHLPKGVLHPLVLFALPSTHSHTAKAHTRRLVLAESQTKNTCTDACMGWHPCTHVLKQACSHAQRRQSHRRRWHASAQGIC